MVSALLEYEWLRAWATATLKHFSNLQVLVTEGFQEAVLGSCPARIWRALGMGRCYTEALFKLTSVGH